MRKILLPTLCLALGAMAACDSNTDTVAGIAGTVGSPTIPITVQPTNVQIQVGNSVQLSTNAGTSPGQVEWLSSNVNIATVSATGVVTGFSVGTVVITVRFVSDRNNAATALVQVLP